MRKTLFYSAILILSGLILSCPPPGEHEKGDRLPDNPRQTWTVMIHFAVDNNIDYEFEQAKDIVSNYLSTLESIEKTDVNNKINIVVLMDSYNVDSQDVGYVSTIKDGYYHITGKDNFNDDLVTNLGEVNSGSLDATKAFMNWAVTNYPADGYMYSVFNHGSGFADGKIDGTYSARGIAFDDGEDDCLSHYELGQATAYLKNLIGHKVDLFYAYACLMGGMELAYELRENADYLLFSEASFPADYWSYEALQTIVDATDGASALDIGKAFCDSAYDYFSDPFIDTAFTLSLISLSGIDGLADAIDDFADAAVTDMVPDVVRTGYYKAAASAFINSYLWYYYIDLGMYLNNVRNESAVSSDVKDYAKTALEKMTNCVAYMKNNYYPATGISIFHNLLYGFYIYPVNLYKAILGFGTNSWADYVGYHDWFGLPTFAADSYEAQNDNNFTTTNTISVDASPQAHTFHVLGDEDYIKVNLTAGNDYTIQTHFSTIPLADTVLFLYDSNQNLISINDDNGGFFFSKIIYSCQNSGGYYIRVYELNNDTGDYTIDVRVGSFSETKTKFSQLIKKK